MRIRKLTVMGAVLVAAITLAGRVSAQQPQPTRVLGTVTAIDANHIEVTPPGGQKQSILLSKETRYFRGKNPASLAAIQVGTGVMVAYAEEGGKKTAQQVRLRTPRPATGSAAAASPVSAQAKEPPKPAPAAVQPTKKK